MGPSAQEGEQRGRPALKVVLAVPRQAQGLSSRVRLGRPAFLGPQFPGPVEQVLPPATDARLPLRPMPSQGAVPPTWRRYRRARVTGCRPRVCLHHLGNMPGEFGPWETGAKPGSGVTSPVSSCQVGGPETMRGSGGRGCWT